MAACISQAGSTTLRNCSPRSTFMFQLRTRNHSVLRWLKRWRQGFRSSPPRPKAREKLLNVKTKVCLSLSVILKLLHHLSCAYLKTRPNEHASANSLRHQHAHASASNEWLTPQSKPILKYRSQESGVRSQNAKAETRFDRFCSSFILTPSS